MAQAADNAFGPLDVSRRLAKHLAAMRPDRTVTADDVSEARVLRGLPESIGNAAGSIFKTKDWEWTGQWVASRRPSNHARMLRVWRLKEDAGDQRTACQQDTLTTDEHALPTRREIAHGT